MLCCRHRYPFVCLWLRPWLCLSSCACSSSHFVVVRTSTLTHRRHLFLTRRNPFNPRYQPALHSAVGALLMCAPDEVVKLFSMLLKRWPHCSSGKAIKLLAQLEDDLEALLEAACDETGSARHIDEQPVTRSRTNSNAKPLPRAPPNMFVTQLVKTLVRCGTSAHVNVSMAALKILESPDLLKQIANTGDLGSYVFDRVGDIAVGRDDQLPPNITWEGEHPHWSEDVQEHANIVREAVQEQMMQHMRAQRQAGQF